MPPDAAQGGREEAVCLEQSVEAVGGTEVDEVHVGDHETAHSRLIGDNRD